MKVTNLKTCHMRNAFGIDETPYFSWWLVSNQENVMQEAYRICVADENGNTIWDSGKVESSHNTFVPYEGHTLESRGLYTWTVTVWNCAKINLLFLIRKSLKIVDFLHSKQ